MTDLPLHGGPCACGDLRREIGVTEPDLVLVLAAARTGLEWLQAQPDAKGLDLQRIAMTLPAIRRMEQTLERKAVPPLPVSAYAESRWQKLVKYPDQTDAYDVATYHPGGTREEILERIRKEADE